VRVRQDARDPVLADATRCAHAHASALRKTFARATSRQAAGLSHGLLDPRGPKATARLAPKGESRKDQIEALRDRPEAALS
jgi:hypothetical protein